MAIDMMEEREQRIPDQLGQLLASFVTNINNGHRANQLDYAAYIEQLVKIQNIEWAVSVGILTLEQALTITANLPILSVVDLSNIGFDNTSFDVEFRVSASQEENTKIGVDTSTQVEVGVGGIAALFGASGSTKIKADTTYQKDTRRASDYSSTVKMHVELKRTPPPEGVQILLDTQNEVIRTAMEINKKIIERQYREADSEADQMETPKTLGDQTESTEVNDEGN